MPGSPFLTGGVNGGRSLGKNHIVSSPVGNLLYASNSLSGNVSGFSIDPVTGSLAALPGSPFAVDGLPGDRGISLAVTPDGQFLVAGNADSGSITVFAIAPNGALAPVPGSPFLGGRVNGMKVCPNGKFLAVAVTNIGDGVIAMFEIAPSGDLVPVPGSPFPDSGLGGPGARAVAMDFNCACDRLFVAEGSRFETIVSVFSVAPDGFLMPIVGSPFVPGGGSVALVPLLSPNEQVLFVSNFLSSDVTVFNVSPDGSLASVPGSPFSATSFPAGMATDRKGKLLYTTGFFSQVGVFDVASNGALTVSGVFGTGQPTGMTSLAEFPIAKTCSVVADAGNDKRAIVGESVEFDGSASFNPVVAIVDFDWDFGDGETANGSIVSNVYVNGGEFTVTLTVTDGDGNTSTDTAAVTIITVSEAIQELLSLVESLDLQTGIATSLVIKLQIALGALEAPNANQRQDAAKEIQSFINYVEALRGQELTDDQADQLIELALRILASL